MRFLSHSLPPPCFSAHPGPASGHATSAAARAPHPERPRDWGLMLCGCCHEIHNCLNFELVQRNMPQGLGAWLTRTPLPGTSLTLDCLLPCLAGPPDPSCCPPGQGVLCCHSGSSGPGGPLSSLQTAGLVIIARPPKVQPNTHRKHT